MSDSVKITERKRCDFCSILGKDTTAEVDGKTDRGPWANMCEVHYILHGVGLGTGRGQRLILEAS